jgi:hypothetical protein
MASDQAFLFECFALTESFIGIYSMCILSISTNGLTLLFGGLTVIVLLQMGVITSNYLVQNQILIGLELIM